MDLLTRPHPTTASIARRLILLVLAAGVIGPGPGGERQVRPGMEILLRTSPLHVTACITGIASGFGIRDFNYLPAYPGTGWHSGVRFKQRVGQINTCALSSPCLFTAFFNIPHQNSDEEEAFVRQPAVA